MATPIPRTRTSHLPLSIPRRCADMPPRVIGRIAKDFTRIERVLLPFRRERSEPVPRQTKFPTIPLHRIQHLLEKAEQLDAEEALAVCLECGHPANDHSIENETCWH